MHNRINSLLNQHKAKKRQTQQQSNSQSKKKKNMIDQSSQLFAPQHFITDFLTFPISTEGQRGSRFLQRQLPHLINKIKSKSKNRIGEKSKSISSKNKKSKSREKKSTQNYQKSLQRNKSKKGKKVSLQSKKKPTKANQLFNKFNSSKKLSPDCLSKAFKITRANSKQTKPMTGHNYEQIIEEYGECLTISEIGQIKEYKNIYFLGKIKTRKNKKLFHSNKKTPKSARDKMNRSSEKKETVEISNLLTQRKANNNDLVIENGNADDQFYKYEIGDHIAYRYQIIQPINSGAFGEVIKVFDHKYKELQALKVVKKSPELVQQTLIEITILTHIREKDKQNLSGIVKIKDFTFFRKHICIAFQLLEGNLYEFVASNNHCELTENAIRIFAVQLLNSLTFLKQQQIIHCDIKPQNIVMKKWGKSGIKLVDFGTSCFEGKQMYEYLQSRFYRSPQIILRTPYSSPIDMWSLGCILAQLKLGQPLFPATQDKQHLLYISKSIGLPHQHYGEYSAQFCKNQHIKQIAEKYYLEQYQLIQDKEQAIKDHPFFSKCKYIKKAMMTLQQKLNNGKNSQQFCDFISKILTWEPEKRLKPQDALQEPWIVEGIPKQVKQIYTFFTSRQKSKESKHKKSRSKSKSKSLGKKQHLNKAPKNKLKGSKTPVKSMFSVKQRQKSVQLPSKKSVFLHAKDKKYFF